MEANHGKARRLRNRFVSSASLNFVAGLFVAAGINLLTSIPTDNGSPSALTLGLLSAPWLILGFVTFWLATVLADLELELALYTNAHLDKDEREEMRETAMTSVRPTLVRVAMLTVALLVAAVLMSIFLPGLLDKSQQCQKSSQSATAGTAPTHPQRAGSGGCTL